MTPDELRALPADQRHAAWQALPEAERRQLSVDLLAATPGFGFPYPSNYADPADSPSALQALATSVDNALGTQIGNTYAWALATFAQGGPTARVTTDWDTATESGFWQSAPGAGNRPASASDVPWLGMVSRYNDNNIAQIAWPVGNGPVPALAVHHRTKQFSVGWSGWSRLANWSYSWGTSDNMLTHMHGPGGGVQRFQSGLKKDTASASPTALDEWRVNCYNASGAFTWTAIKIPESGVVSFPKGHTLLVERIAAGEPIARDTVLTVGALAVLLERAGIDIADLVNLADEEG